jgi:hypothetical protein
MNAVIGVGSINVSFSAILVEPTPVARIIFVVKSENPSPMTFSRSTIISINGHSLSAITPDALLIGGKATLVTA